MHRIDTIRFEEVQSKSWRTQPVYTAVLALPVVPSRIAVSRQKKRANHIYAFGLALVWLLLLLAALSAEMAVALGVGGAVRMLFVDSPAQIHDAARLGR